MTQSTPPGWYTDPQNAGQRRYWDGSAWTDQTQPAPPPPGGNIFPATPPASAKQGKAQGRADRAYRKASRPWPLRHPIFTGLALLVLIIIIAVAASGGSSPSTTGGGSPGDETAGKVLQHSEDVTISKCGRDSFGYLKATVSVTNHSSKPSDYLITVAFEGKSTGDQIETGDAFVDSLQPGQSATKSADALRKYAKPFKCVLSDAERTESSF